MTPPDRTTTHLVVILLGAVALLCVAGVIGLVAIGKAAPDSLIALGGTAVGSVGSILVQGRSTA